MNSIAVKTNCFDDMILTIHESIIKAGLANAAAAENNKSVTGEFGQVWHIVTVRPAGEDWNSF